MKKVLFFLLIVALAAFLFTGCLPVTPSEGEDEGEGEAEEEIVLLIEDEYLSAGGETFVACGRDVTVTFPTAVEVDYVVYVAVKYWDDDSQEYKYYHMTAGEPDAARTTWTFQEYIETFCETKIEEFCLKECEPLCLVALVKHPCCPGEEVALKIVTVDCEPPFANLRVLAHDCGDPCQEVDPCEPPVSGAYLELTSSYFDECEMADCCGDDCSGFANWSIEIYDDNPFNELCQIPCMSPIDTLSGTGCPIFGETICLEEELYYVVVTLLDNAGNQTRYFATIDLSSPCLPGTVDFSLTFPGSGDGYFTTNVTADSEYDFLNDSFAGWCADAYTLISTSTGYTANIYSSVDIQLAPDCIQERPWGSINWILNNWQNISSDWKDAQVAIWTLIHEGCEPGGYPCTCIFTTLNLSYNVDNVNELLENACSNSDYIPGENDLVAVILLVNNQCPGGTNPKQMTYFGISINELYCQPVEVIEYTQNELGCTDWQEPILKPVEHDYYIGTCDSLANN